QEITEAGGQALVLPIDRLHGEAEQHLIQAFRPARGGDYRQHAAEAGEAERAGRTGLEDRLEKLRRRFAEVARIDFFQAPERAEVEAALGRIENLLSPSEKVASEVLSDEIERYRGRRWVTRPHPHV